MIFDELAFSIVERAVDDYKLLKRLKLEKLDFYDEGSISKRELEKFFRSEWCDFLLGNMRITGKDILRFLNRE